MARTRADLVLVATDETPRAGELPDLSLRSVPAFDALMRRLDELEARKATLAAAYRDDAAIKEHAREITIEPPRRAGADALLDGLLPTQTAIVRMETPDETRGRLVRELVDIEAAIAVLRDIERHAALDASDEICARVRPEHQRRATALAEAALTFARALRSYNDLRAELRRHSVRHAQLDVLVTSDFGDPGETNSPLGAFLRDAARSGYINRAAVKEFGR